MKNTQKKKITRNYHLLRRVEPWKCCRVTAFICPNWSGILTNAWNISKKKKTIFLSPEIVKWNSFMLFQLMMMNSASLQMLWMWAACISLHTFQRTLRVSARRGQRTLIGEQRHATQYRNTVRKIGKYRNTVPKIDEILILHLFSVPFTWSCIQSRVFVYLKHLCTSNQPQPLRGNVRRPRIDR